MSIDANISQLLLHNKNDYYAVVKQQKFKFNKNSLILEKIKRKKNKTQSTQNINIIYYEFMRV